MADVKISGLPASTTPLAGTEVLPIVQGGQTRQVSVANLTAGRAVSATTVSATTSVTTPVIQATSSAGGTLKNNGGTAQLQWGSGGGSNLSFEVATNINPANAAVAISPTGTGTVTINPATASTMNNVAIGGSTPLAGTFTSLTSTGNTILGDASTDTLNVGNGGLIKDASNNVGVGITPSAWTGAAARAIQVGTYASLINSDGITDVGNNLYANYSYLNTNFASFYRQFQGKHQWFNAPSGTAGNAITFTERMTLHASGGLSLGNTVDPGATNLSVTGNVIQGTAARGFNFTANTPAAGMTSQLLNWYEEGTWTPSVGGTATYTIQTGRYTRIGRQVYASFDLQINVLGTGSATTISGLPFAVGTNQGGSSYYFSNLALSVVSLSAAPVASTVVLCGLTAAAVTTTYAISALTDNSRIQMLVTYII